LTFIPMAWAFLLSLSTSDLITPGHYVGAANYRALQHDEAFRQSVENTLKFFAICLPFELVLGLGIALMLNQRIRLKSFYRTCFLVPWIASSAAEGILFAFVFDPNFGAANWLLSLVGIGRQGFLENPDQALFVLMVVYLWGYLGLNVVIYLAALQDIKPEIMEAAAIDGARAWGRFRHVVVPAVSPITVFLAVWGAIDALQLFDLVFVTTKGGPLGQTTTVVYYVYQQAFQFFNAGYGAAVAYTLFAGSFVVLVLALYLERRYSEP
jgi:multiple sugar transport system permease protein